MGECEELEREREREERGSAKVSHGKEKLTKECVQRGE
jgi:hypothetical protein